jgi:hypothetical protein
MDVKKLWENTEANPEITNVCDVYGAEHLARLIGTYFPPSPFIYTFWLT